MRVLPQSAQNRPMPAQSLPVLYWSEAEGGWWPRINHFHRVCGGGWLRATPPGAVAHDIGWVTCDRCGVDVAEIRYRRPPAMTPAEWQALPAEQGRRGRPPKTAPKRVRAPQQYGQCVDCRQPTHKRRSQRCRTCWERTVTENANVTRLIVLLGDGRTAHRRDLAKQLGITANGFRHVVQRARRSGRPLVSEGRDWLRLEVS